MKVCERCGRCCHYMKNGKLKKCKFLVKLNNGKTLCRVYKTRLGRVIDRLDNGNVIVCRNRVDSAYDYKGCPLNTDKPVWEEEN